MRIWATWLPSHLLTCTMQLSDLVNDTWPPYPWGFVQLALDTESNTKVTIKFIERSYQVGCTALQSAQVKRSSSAADSQGA